MAVANVLLALQRLGLAGATDGPRTGRHAAPERLGTGDHLAVLQDVAGVAVAVLATGRAGALLIAARGRFGWTRERNGRGQQGNDGEGSVECFHRLSPAFLVSRTYSIPRIERKCHIYNT